MRLIAERLLQLSPTPTEEVAPGGIGGAPGCSAPAPVAASSTYVDKEIIRQKLRPLPPPLSDFHAYCSPLNLGALEIMREVSRERGFECDVDGAHMGLDQVSRTTKKLTGRLSKMTGLARLGAAGMGAWATARGSEYKPKLALTSDVEQLCGCDHIILYLTSQTWTRGEASEALGRELMRAMDLNVNVLLVHEMAGMGGQEARFGCEFGSFFSCADGATPGELLKRGIYSSIAVALKGGQWREVSMVLLGMALGMSKEEAEVAREGKDIYGLDAEDSKRAYSFRASQSLLLRVKSFASSKRLPKLSTLLARKEAADRGTSVDVTVISSTTAHEGHEP